jgi:hypothetical protein
MRVTTVVHYVLPFLALITYRIFRTFGNDGSF